MNDEVAKPKPGRIRQRIGDGYHFLMHTHRDATAAIAILATCIVLIVCLWCYQTYRLNIVMAFFETTRSASTLTTASQDAQSSPVSRFEEEEQLSFLKDLLKIEFDARGGLAQIGLVAGVLGSLYFAYRNVRTSQENLRVAQENTRLSQENVRLATESLLTTQKGQVTERFTRAIDQLGAVADDKPNLEVRLGGIYALEGIARDSSEYREVIVDVLSAYVRRNATSGINPAGWIIPFPEDIGASLTVFERLRIGFGKLIIPNLSRVNMEARLLHDISLPEANLSQAHLAGAGMTGANLSGTNLQSADLSRAFLADSNLSGARLGFANLTEADLSNARLDGAEVVAITLSRARLDNASMPHLEFKAARLDGASLIGANLSEADLSLTDLTEADLTVANMTGANLMAATLTNANLTGANLTGANLTAATLTNANLTGANLAGADLTGAIVLGTILEAAPPPPPEPPTADADASATHPEPESPPDASTPPHP